MSFAMGSSSADERSDEEWAVDALRALDVPQLQAVNASVSSAEWLASGGGLSPLDVAMNVAIPELDGRIITVPLSFKEQQAGVEVAGTPVVRRVAPRDRADRVIGQALRLAALRRKPNAEKRVAVVLTNHNAKASRIANAVGLDSPASLLHLLHRMRAAGYDVGDELPPDSDTLMADLVERGHYDNDLLTDEQIAGALARVTAERYRAWFARAASRARRRDARPVGRAARRVLHRRRRHPGAGRPAVRQRLRRGPAAARLRHGQDRQHAQARSRADLPVPRDVPLAGRARRRRRLRGGRRGPHGEARLARMAAGQGRRASRRSATPSCSWATCR